MHGKGNHWQNKKTTYRMGENICRWYDHHRVNIQNSINSSYNSISKKKPDNPIKTWAEDLNRNVSKDVQMVNRHTERCSICLLITERQIKTMFYLPSVRMAVIKKPTSNKCWRGCGEKEPLCTVDENVSLTQPVMKTVGKFLKLKSELPYDSAIPLRGINPGKNTNLKRNLKPNVHSTIYNSQDTEAT